MFWQVLVANVNELVMGAGYTWLIWFLTRHTYGKYPWRWFQFGPPENKHTKKAQ